MKKVFLILIVFISFSARAQKIDSIYFNLYTDSLKKGVHNYINVDGKLQNGRYIPLMIDEIIFTSTIGKWEGNSIILDSGSKADSVIITATLASRPELKKTVVVYIKKVDTAPPLKSEKELLEEWRKEAKHKNE